VRISSDSTETSYTLQISSLALFSWETCWVWMYFVYTSGYSILLSQLSMSHENLLSALVFSSCVWWLLRWS